MRKNERSHRSHRRLEVQHLEDRKLMAGDVAVGFTIANGNIDIDITGDSQNNAVEVRQIGGNIRVRGLNVSGSGPTTVNGGSQALIPIQHIAPGRISFLDDINIDMGAGSDTLRVRDLNMNFRSHSDLNIDSGLGTDNISLQNVNVRDDIVLEDAELSFGVDSWWLTNVTAGDDITADLHAGRDNFFGTNVFADRLDIDTGAHDDYVSLFNTNVDVLQVAMQGGSDRLRLQASDIAYAELDGGTGVDSLDLSGNPNDIDRLRVRSFEL